MIRLEKPSWYDSVDCIACIFYIPLLVQRHCHVTINIGLAVLLNVIDTRVNSSLMLSSGSWLCINC